MRLTLFCLLFSFSGMAQWQLPEGYTIQQSPDGKANKIEQDFNGDGKNDLFAVLGNKQQEIKLFAAISSKDGYKAIHHAPLEYLDCCNRVECKNNIVKVFSNGMRYFENYTFRFNKTTSTFDFIGYDNESFGNAVHDGAGFHSINLLTGLHKGSVYQSNPNNPEDGKARTMNRKEKLPKKYTLSTFDAAMKWIEKIVQE